jgi:hypothetical protein
MRILYLTIILASFAMTLKAQAQTDLDFSRGERLDLAKSVQIYPNPAADEYIHVKVDHINLAETKVTLHNIIGNEMKVEKDLLDEHTLRIKVKDLATGYYLIGLNDDKHKLNGIYKFLKL